MKKINSFVFTVIIFFMPSIHGMEQANKEETDYPTIFMNDLTPQEKIFLELLTIHQQQATDEEVINFNDDPNNNLKHQQKENTTQNQQNYKEQPICSQYNKTFSNTNNLKQHIANVHSNKTYQLARCPYPDCNRIYSLQTLNAHIKKHDKKYNCSYCEKKFYAEKALIIHNRIHTGEKISCTYNNCTSTFISKNSLNRHIKTFHQ